MSLILLQQLYAMRAQLEAAIMQLEADQVQITSGCPHPADKQRNATTMGGQPTVLCLECGDERPGVVAS